MFGDAIDFVRGYGLSRFRLAVATGNLVKIKQSIEYYRSHNRLDRILHDSSGAALIKASPGFYGSNLLFDAFRDLEHPHYEAAFMLLDAGSKPSYADPLGGNIYHLTVNRKDINFFMYMLFCDQVEFADCLTLPYRLTSVTLDQRLTEWDEYSPGIKEKIGSAADDAKAIRVKFAEATVATSAVKAQCYFDIAQFYLKHAHNSERVALYRHRYLLKAYIAFQQANEVYEGVSGHDDSVNAIQTLTHLIAIAGELDKHDDRSIFIARKSLYITHDNHPTAQATFLDVASASSSSTDYSARREPLTHT